MRFSTPREPAHSRRQRNADQLHHHLIIPALTATPKEPLTTVGNAAAPSSWDPGVRHPLRQRRAHPPALPPPSPSPPPFNPTTGDARSQHRHRGPPGSFRASFSEDADTEVGAGEGTDDEYEDVDGRPVFVPGPRYPYPRSSAREIAPRFFSHPHNLRAHPSGVNSTRIAAQPVCHSPLLRSPSDPLSRYLPPPISSLSMKIQQPLSLFEMFHASDLSRQLRPRWHSHQHHNYPYGSSTRTI